MSACNQQPVDDVCLLLCTCALQGALSSRQQQLLEGFGQLEQQQKQQAAEAAAAWQQLAADAAALEERQLRYESLQVRCQALLSLRQCESRCSCMLMSQ
jgi:hypothetical protein